MATALCNNTSTTWLTECSRDHEHVKFSVYKYVYLLVFPVAFLINAVVLVVFYLQSRHRSSNFSVVVMNLALSDCSFSLTLPLRSTYYFQGAVWSFPDWLCRVCQYFFYVNLYTSILFLTLLTVLRWLAVAKPHYHRSQATPTRTLLVCLGIWLFVGGSSAPFLYSGVTIRENLPRCFEPSCTSSVRRVLIMNYMGTIVGFLLPFFIIIICYCSIIRHLMGQSGLSRTPNTCQRNRRHSAHMITIVTATFLLCFLPYHVTRAVHLHATYNQWDCGVRVWMQLAVVVTLCLAASNSVVNPLLYYYSTKMFRNNAMFARFSILSSRRLAMRSRKTETEEVHQPPL
ncbi:cysteinyl leukotriene receptor 2-like [Solea solea]|uniref:cysteinyl leukotriene receptor 2-like n=1 Tax=Solea solea TaxID=90069 RepID=UPI00272D021D|nr:cysteinyl leukotriene receptor 2-like [Solea solea]XP_058480625.1 cysteinyl leukotriene receptor 2-like [Solea solea]